MHCWNGYRMSVHMYMYVSVHVSITLNFELTCKKIIRFVAYQYARLLLCASSKVKRALEAERLGTRLPCSAKFLRICNFSKFQNFAETIFARQQMCSLRIQLLLIETESESMEACIS